MKKCTHKNKKGFKERYHIPNFEYNNCLLCLINEKGALSQKEVAEVLEISVARVGQIERKAIKKLSKRNLNFLKNAFQDYYNRNIQ